MELRHTASPSLSLCKKSIDCATIINERAEYYCVVRCLCYSLAGKVIPWRMDEGESRVPGRYSPFYHIVTYFWWGQQLGIISCH